MNNDLSDILSNSNKDIDNQQLMDYLGNKLSAKDKHELEKEMVDSEFINDALEGLQDFNNKQEVPLLVQQLNSTLRKQLSNKKRRKLTRKFKDQPWIVLAIVLIIVLAIVCFIVIKYLNP